MPRRPKSEVEEDDYTDHLASFDVTFHAYCNQDHHLLTTLLLTLFGYWRQLCRLVLPPRPLAKSKRHASAKMPPAQPNWPQVVVSSTLLLVLSIFLAPLSLLFIIPAYLSEASALIRPSESPRFARRTVSRKPAPVALVNGGRMQKALTVARALAQQGYTVIGVEESG